MLHGRVGLMMSGWGCRYWCFCRTETYNSPLAPFEPLPEQGMSPEEIDAFVAKTGMQI